MGSLTLGTFLNSTATVSLTVAISDWSIWNASWVATAVRSGGGATISNPVIVGGGSSSSYSLDPRMITWTGGSISAAGSMTNGIFVAGQPGAGFSFSVGAGFSLTFPADTTSRNAVVYIGIYSCTAWITATMSDGSASPLTLTSTAVLADTVQQYAVDFNYTANSPGQTLTVAVTMRVNTSLIYQGNVNLQAAAYSTGAAPVLTAPYTFMLLGVGSGR